MQTSNKVYLVGILLPIRKKKVTTQCPSLPDNKKPDKLEKQFLKTLQWAKDTDKPKSTEPQKVAFRRREALHHWSYPWQDSRRKYRPRWDKQDTAELLPGWPDTCHLAQWLEAQGAAAPEHVSTHLWTLSHRPLPTWGWQSTTGVREGEARAPPETCGASTSSVRQLSSETRGES